MAARPWASFQPLEYSSRKPRESVRLRRTRMTSSAWNAAKSERQLSGVGEGSKRKVPTVPLRNWVRLVKVAWPNWLSAMFSLD